MTVLAMTAGSFAAIAKAGQSSANSTFRRWLDSAELCEERQNTPLPSAPTNCLLAEITHLWRDGVATGHGLRVDPYAGDLD